MLNQQSDIMDGHKEKDSMGGMDLIEMQQRFHTRSKYNVLLRRNVTSRGLVIIIHRWD